MQRNKPDFYGVLLSCFKLAWQLWKLVQSEVLVPDKVLQLPAGVLSRQKADSSTRQCILIELYKMCSYLTARVCRALFYAASFFRPKPFSLLFFLVFLDQFCLAILRADCQRWRAVEKKDGGKPRAVEIVILSTLRRSVQNLLGAVELTFWALLSLHLQGCGTYSKMNSAQSGIGQSKTWFAALTRDRWLLKAGSRCEGRLKIVRVGGRLRSVAFHENVPKDSAAVTLAAKSIIRGHCYRCTLSGCRAWIQDATVVVWRAD